MFICLYWVGFLLFCFYYYYFLSPCLLVLFVKFVFFFFNNPLKSSLLFLHSCGSHFPEVSEWLTASYTAACGRRINSVKASHKGKCWLCKYCLWKPLSFTLKPAAEQYNKEKASSENLAQAYRQIARIRSR